MRNHRLKRFIRKIILPITLSAALLCSCAKPLPEPIRKLPKTKIVKVLSKKENAEKSVKLFLNTVKGKKGYYPDINKMVVRALLGIGPDAIPPLIKALNINHGTIIEIAEDALSKFDRKVVLSALIETIQNKQLKDEERRAAADFLGKIGKKSMIPRLFKLINTKDTLAASLIIEVIGKIGDRTQVAPLLKLFKDKENKNRNALAETLGWIVGKYPEEDLVKKVVSALLDERQNGDMVLKTHIYMGIVQIGIPAIPYLINSLKKDSDTAGFAAYTLGKISKGNPKKPKKLIAAALVRSLQYNNRYVQSRAAKSLEEICELSVVPELTDLKNQTKDKRLKKMIERTLRSIIKEHFKDVPEVQT
jgi:HEAT repeat protein